MQQHGGCEVMQMNPNVSQQCTSLDAELKNLIGQWPEHCCYSLIRRMLIDGRERERKKKNQQEITLTLIQTVSSKRIVLHATKHVRGMFS